jgi:hypothetical protein
MCPTFPWSSIFSVCIIVCGQFGNYHARGLPKLPINILFIIEEQRGDLHHVREREAIFCESRNKG